MHITLPQAFDRPLQLTPEQARGPGGGRLDAAHRARRRPRRAAGPGPGQALGRGGRAGGDASLEVRLGEVRDDVLETLRTGVRQHRQVAIDYYAYGRDTHTHRVIDPYRVTSDQGQWYAAAWCHLADDERLFRLDRISTRRAARHHLRPAGRPAARVGLQPVGRRPAGGHRARARGPLGGRAVPGRGRSTEAGRRPGPGHPGRDRAGLARAAAAAPGSGGRRSSTGPTSCAGPGARRPRRILARYRRAGESG